MALITYQSFDPHLWGVTHYYDGWTDVNGSNAPNGRRGTNAIAVVLSGGYFQYSTPGTNHATGILGFAFQFGLPTQAVNREFIAFYDAATEQFKLRLNTDFSISILDAAGTVIASSAAGVIEPQRFHYIEVKATVSATGSYEIRVDEQAVLAGINADLQASGNAFFNAVRFQYPGGDGANPSMWDDMYLLDDSGADFNDFLGDVQIDTLFVSGAGFQADWTPLSGNNEDNVDEDPLDEDTTYNSSNTPGDIDLFEMDDLPDINGSTVLAVAIDVAMRHDAGTPTMRTVTRLSGTNYEGANQVTASAYQYEREVYETNPDTGLPWTEADVNAMQAGYKFQS